MPASAPELPAELAARLRAIGELIRSRRKALGVSATSAAEAAGMSRVTLHRIEKGEPSVTMGAYFGAMAALGLSLEVGEPGHGSSSIGAGREGWIPVRIRLSEYPQLKQLAWHVHGTDSLTPAEALGIYERNWRHLDLDAMEPAERQLIDALRMALGEGREDV